MLTRLIKQLIIASRDHMDDMQELRLHRLQSLTVNQERTGYALTREKRLLAGVAMNKEAMRTAYQKLVKYHNMIAEAENHLSDYCGELEERLEKIYKRHENKELHYGRCPICGESCQPEDIHDRNIEYVSCDECVIQWTLHHEDDTDRRDDTEPWRTYRISNIERDQFPTRKGGE